MVKECIVLLLSGASIPLAFFLLLQLGWCLALSAIGALFWNVSLKKITVNGG